MILLSSPLKNDPTEITVSKFYFLEIETVATKIATQKFEENLSSASVDQDILNSLCKLPEGFCHLVNRSTASNFLLLTMHNLSQEYLLVWFLFNSKHTQNNHQMTGFLMSLFYAPIAALIDALINPTGAIKVSSAEPVMVCTYT